MTFFRFSVVLACWASSLWGAPPVDVANDLKHIKVISLYESVDSLPTWLKSRLADKFNQQELSLASPGRTFRKSEIITEGSREISKPSRRLIRAFSTRNFYYVFYEKGGYENSAAILIFNRTELVWGAGDLLGHPYPKSPSKISRRVLSGNMIDNLPLIW